ncbi:MAG: c-type cytochrome [Burkholderiaceae bacterium]|jgi:mono/diheme cytochrome c family protein
MTSKDTKNLTPPHLREGADPDEHNRPLPWFLVMLLGAMAMWGGFYIYTTPSGTDTAWGDQRSREALMDEVKTAGAATSADGAQIFGAKCAACHQATGLGVPGVFPPLAGSEWVVGSDKQLTQILLHGVAGEIVVKGNTYKGAMPSFKTLSDAEIAAVASYIRTQWGNVAVALTPQLVTEQRETSKDRTTPFAGGAELQALP